MIADLPAGRGIDILMFHSISDGPPPLCIAPRLFRDQLSALEDRGLRGISLRMLVDALRSGAPGLDRCAVLTFDDGYRDFEEEAFPEIRRRGWSCTVFVASGAVGAPAGALPWAAQGQALLDWHALRELVSSGVDVGAHGVTHRALPGLSGDEACREIAESGATLAARTGHRPVCFAPPFGQTTPALLGEIARHYDCSAGTRQARLRRRADLFDLPRLEMWYFRDRRRWQRYLATQLSPYLTMRRAARQLRRLVP
jgi:peptidoglycan/xylan/chitin deacetylase (PgdA/CDA1 family)